MKPFYVYMLRCADQSYYVGHTDELEHRVAQHHAGEIEGYTQARRPVQLVWSQETASRDEALGAERRIKGWSRAKKEALIAGDWASVAALAKSRHARASTSSARTGGARSAARPDAPQPGPHPVCPEPGLLLVRPQPGLFPVRPEPGLFPVRPEPGLFPVRPEPVEGPTTSELSPPPVRPEPVEGPRHALGSSANPRIEAPALASSPSPVRAAPAEAPARASSPPPVRPEPVEGLIAERLRQRDRRALAKAITLVESTRADHRARADALLDALLPGIGQSLRIGISGVPGVGKSTFIEALGLFLIERGHRVAVLAVDPSSSVSGGSILGDKTRMERLSVNEAAFIRPSPTSGALGGVAEHTREALLLCEAAGFDIVIVETVGVGQSETTVAGMTDLFVLMQLPNAGDDLQAIKRGVMELADLVVINKADLDDAAATRAQAQITSALRIFGFHGKASQQASAAVLKLSALKGDGLEAFWQAVQASAQRRRDSGAFDARRRLQRRSWLWDIVHARLRADFEQHAAVRKALPRVLAEVDDARTAPTVAARTLLNLFEKT